MLETENGKTLVDFTCKKTQRFFPVGSSTQSISNHLRKHYENSEIAYREEFEISAPICKECGQNEAKFNSFFHGYNDHCLDDACKKIRSFKTNRKIAEDRVKFGYDEFLIQHHLNDLHNLHENRTPFFDKFLNKSHKDFRNILLASETGLKDDRFKEARTCVVCESEFLAYINENKDFCSYKCGRTKPSLTYLTRYHNFIDADQILDERKSIENSSLLDFSILCKNRKILRFPIGLRKVYPEKWCIFSSFQNSIDSFFDENLGLWCSVKLMTKGLIRKNATAFLLNLKGLMTEEQLKKYDDEKKCSVCGSKFYLPNMFKLDDSNNYIERNRSNFDYCSEQCYFTALRENKSVLYPYTDEYRQNQSNTMINKIRSGEFTPKSNNRRTHWFKFNDIYYRSSWEYAFHMWCILNSIDIEYEKTRIEYKDIETHKRRIYVVDFTDEKSKNLYEVGPQSIKNRPKERNKIEHALQWSNDNEYTFNLITEEFFRNLTPDTKNAILDMSKNDVILSKKLEKLFKL